MKTIPQALLLGALCCCLASCWSPEKFTAALNVDKEQNFQFTYDGTLAFVPALGEIKNRGRLTQKDEAEMKKGEQELLKESGFKTVEYIGSGRFKVHYEESGAVQDGKKIFFDLIEFHTKPDGHISILGAEIGDEGRQQLSSIGLDLDGQLKITSDLDMVSHNATSTPLLGGLIGSYQWHISLDQKTRPEIVLQPAVFGPAKAQTMPASPFVVQDAHPFEGCQYGAWTARETASLYDKIGGTILTRLIQKGEHVLALTGEVHAIPQRATVTGVYKSDEEQGIHIGSIVYFLYPLGEGAAKVWHEGKSKSGSMDLTLKFDSAETENQSWDWWVKVRLEDGTIGWLKNPRSFNGMDRFG